MAHPSVPGQTLDSPVTLDDFNRSQQQRRQEELRRKQEAKELLHQRAGSEMDWQRQRTPSSVSLSSAAAAKTHEDRERDGRTFASGTSASIGSPEYMDSGTEEEEEEEAAEEGKEEEKDGDGNDDGGGDGGRANRKESSGWGQLGGWEAHADGGFSRAAPGINYGRRRAAGV